MKPPSCAISRRARSNAGQSKQRQYRPLVKPEPIACHAIAGGLWAAWQKITLRHINPERPSLMAQSIARPAIVLGLMSCIGPFAIDMYLPAMPAIGSDLGTSVQAMQASITAYFLAFGLAQLLYGCLLYTSRCV